MFDPAIDRVSVGHNEVKIRAGSAGRSRRESSLLSSQLGGLGFSPGTLGRAGFPEGAEDFEFNGNVVLKSFLDGYRPSTSPGRRSLSCGVAPV